MCLQVSPLNENVVFAGAQDLFRSTDGNEFIDVSGYNGAPSHPDFHCIEFNPFFDNIILTGNDGGIYKSADQGNSFTALDNNIALTQIYKIKSHPVNNGKIFIGVQDEGL